MKVAFTVTFIPVIQRMRKNRKLLLFSTKLIALKFISSQLILGEKWISIFRPRNMNSESFFHSQSLLSSIFLSVIAVVSHLSLNSVIEV
jgi:hypothetical protein